MLHGQHNRHIKLLGRGITCLLSKTGQGNQGLSFVIEILMVLPISSAEGRQMAGTNKLAKETGYLGKGEVGLGHENLITQPRLNKTRNKMRPS